MRESSRQAKANHKVGIRPFKARGTSGQTKHDVLCGWVSVRSFEKPKADVMICWLAALKGRTSTL